MRELPVGLGRRRELMTGCDDDHLLIAACRAGKTEAFGILVRRYQDRLYPTILRLAGSADDALDLLQDAFLRAYEKLGSFHGESSFYTWIYRIAVNLALSDRRKRKRGSWRLREDARGEPIDPVDDLELTDPSIPLEHEERGRQIQEALADLAPDHRAVIVLKDLDGLRYEEIAATLDVPIGTVRSRLHRARFELRERLRGMFEEPQSRQARRDPKPAERPIRARELTLKNHDA